MSSLIFWQSLFPSPLELLKNEPFFIFLVYCLYSLWLGRFPSWHCIICLIRLAHGLFLHEYTATDLPFTFFKYLCTQVWNSLFADTHASKMWLYDCFWKTNACTSSWWLWKILQTICMNNLRNLLQAFSGLHFLKASQVKTLLEWLSEAQLLFSAAAFLEHFVHFSCICTNCLQW